VTTILTSDPGKAVFQNATVQIAVNHLPDIRAEKSIFLFKTILVNLLECFKTIFDTTVAYFFMLKTVNSETIDNAKRLRESNPQKR